MCHLKAIRCFTLVNTAPLVVVDSTAYPSEMWKIVEQGNDGVRAGLGNKHGKDTRCTQVRGPLVEVTPLRPAILVSYCKIKIQATIVLLELFLVVASLGSKPAGGRR